jgi:hypothetical protein
MTTAMTRLHAAAEHSVVAHLLRRAAAAFRFRDAAIVAAGDYEDEATRIRDLVATSRIGRWGGGVADAFGRLWADSSARATTTRIGQALREMSAAERVRAAGIWAAAAAVTDALLTGLDPRPSTVDRWVLWAGLLALAIAAAVWSEAAVAAWIDWRGRRTR